jgi:tetratricopeptide (TPR) repeat protein
MRGFSLVSERLGLDAPAQVAYLDQCLKVSQYNEAAWLEVASLVKSGELLADQKQVVTAHLSTLYRTLGDYPDFIRRLLDDLVAIEADPSDKIRVYEQAVSLYERARRPDLACDARLKITDQWCQQNRWQTAAQGLIFSVRKFPTEGRYVPRMTEKLQEVSGNYTGGSAKLAQLYLEIVPAMFAYYYDDDSTYAKTMYEQAMAYFQDNQMTRQAAALELKARQFGVATSTRRGG